MATDFSYNNKTIQITGPAKPAGKDQPLDPRGRVKLYSDIESIPNPYVGMKVTVLQDENHNGEMFEYKVKGLKANSLGIANSVIDMDQLVPYAEFLGVSSSGGGTGAGLTSEQAQQLQTAYEHSQSDHVQPNDLLNIDAVSLNGKKISNPMTKAEYDAIADKDPNTIYLVDDDTVIECIPSYGSTEANKVLAVNSDGTALAWVDAPTGSGSGLTTEQAQQLTTAYEHSQTSHFDGSYNKLSNKPNIPSKLSELQNDANFVTSDIINSITTIPEGSLILRDLIENEIFSTIIEVDGKVYGNIVTSYESVNVNEGESTSFTVNLDNAPTDEQIVILSKDNDDSSIDKTSLTFNGTNYNVPQTINVTTIDDSDYNDKATTITLSSPNVESKIVTINIINTDTVSVQSVSLDKSAVSVEQNKTITLSATISPENSTNKNVIWSTNNSNCSVEGDGLDAIVTGVTLGETIITVTTQDGNKTASCTVTVNEATVVDLNDNLVCNYDFSTGSNVQTTLYDTKNNIAMSLIDFNFDGETNGWLEGGLKGDGTTKYARSETLPIEWGSGKYSFTLATRATIHLYDENNSRYNDNIFGIGDYDGINIGCFGKKIAAIYKSGIVLSTTKEPVEGETYNIILTYDEPTTTVNIYVDGINVLSKVVDIKNRHSYVATHKGYTKTGENHSSKNTIIKGLLYKCAISTQNEVDLINNILG